MESTKEAGRRVLTELMGAEYVEKKAQNRNTLTMSCRNTRKKSALDASGRVKAWIVSSAASSTLQC